jgi:hypothetical protein
MEPEEPERHQGRSIDEAGEQLLGDLGELRDRVAERTEQLRESVTSFVQERPITSVGIAFGVGYLLSGALVSRTTGRLLGLGTRILFGALLKQVIAGGGLGALWAMVPEPAEERRGS